MAGSRIAVYGAIAANVAIAVTKYAVAGVTGSSAMLSEAVHSTVDTGNGLLLLVGLTRSERPPSQKHPFGHGKELYFWSLIVGVLIFGFGGGISIYEGVLHLRHPEPIRDAFWNYLVLGAAFLFEGTSFVIALRQFRRSSRDQPLLDALHGSKDPSTYTVLAEDGAALAGLAIAAAGIWLGHRFGEPAFDGIASVLIGLLLAGVAVLLIYESRGLLVGEGVRPETAREIRAMALRQQGVTGIGPLLSMYIGAEEALLTFDLEFEPGSSGERIAQAIGAIDREIRARWPNIRRIYIEPQIPQR
jgi:cation diffusion facilitator family transporter